MEKILNKHWSILLEDSFLQSSHKPKVFYRKAHNFQSKVAPSKMKILSSPIDCPLTLFALKGMYQCKKKVRLTCKS